MIMTTISFSMPTTLTLDELSAMDSKQLENLYRAGCLPETFATLDGTPKGRMLAVRYLDHAPFLSVVTAWAESSFFPWDGKNFQATGPVTGKGINRIKLLKEFRWYPFEARLERSLIDGKECIYLDYEQPDNPWFIRRIRDELREVAPRLFLGTAMWKDGQGGAALVLWFALDNHG
jgi:hypothetical protein